jgi:AraC family transcriptional regulator
LATLLVRCGGQELAFGALEKAMYQDRSWRKPPSEGLDGDIALILIKLLREASRYIGRDSLATHACLDRASALLESERSRAAHHTAELQLGSRKGLLAPWQVNRVTAHVSENLDAPIRLYELAQLTRLTASYFSRAFKTTFGMAPQDYVALRRMNLACILMLTTNQPLCQVALACGLSDQAQFSKVFSRTFGQPPGAWRRERRGFVARA